MELSIVLVILGLLTGGILAGQSLIRAAEVRGGVVEYQRYYAALQGFREKYRGLPGDLRNATDFWGKLSAYCNDHPGAASVNSTCNGNGNGVINVISSAIVNSTTEEAQVWRQLALAGMIEGSYSGVSDASGGLDLPPSRLGRATWRFRTLGDLSGPVTGTLVTTFALDYGTVLELASYSATGYLVTPEEGWNVDTKLDDGLPAQGRFIIRGWDNNCTTAADRIEVSAQYNVAYKSKVCSVFMFRQL